MPTGPNPARYARMCEPHESLRAAQDALNNFYDAVEKAREEFRIADVSVVAEIVYDDDEKRAQSSSHFGANLNRLPMLARAYGAAREQYEVAIANTIADARKQERDR